MTLPRSREDWSLPTISPGVESVTGRPGCRARHRLWPATATVLALGLLVWPVRISPFASGIAASFDLAILSLVVAGWVMLYRPSQRSNGALMMVLALVASTAPLRDASWGPWSFIGSVLYPVSGLLLAQLLIRWPGVHLQTRTQRWVLRIAWIGVPALTLLDLVAWDPAWGGYSGQAWWLTLIHVPELETALFKVSQGFQGAGLLALLLLVAARLVRASRPERYELASVALSASAFAAFALADAIGALTGRVVLGVFILLSNVSLLAVPLGFLVSAGVRRVQRSLAVEALLQPNRLRSAASVRLALARALGDKNLTLALWSTDDEAYLDADGGLAPENAAADHSIYLLATDGAPLARIGVRNRVTTRVDVIEAVTRAAGIPLEHARFQAELRAAQLGSQRSLDRLSEAEGTRQRLSRLLPGGLAERVGADPGVLTRTDLLTVTVLMSDVRGFTTLAEQAPPALLAAQLNEHRQAMNEAVIAEGGTVMQYVGDAVMAVFGAPERLDNHEERALAAAAAMHFGQRQLDAQWARRGLQPFGLGIGLSTGQIAAAFLGSQERMEYTIVGDTVNLAARLCDAARPAGVTVATAATVMGSDTTVPCIPLPNLRVKGRAAAVSAYQITTPG